jgi:hypothetical protein
MLHRIPTPLPVNLTPQGGGKLWARIKEWIYVLYSLDIGFILLCLPWQGYWENNYLLYLYPQIRPLVTNHFFKGFVLGLGIVNILIGIRDVMHITSVKQKNWFAR